MKAIQSLLFLLVAGIFFEYMLFPPFELTSTKNIPSVYSWLKEQKSDSIVAEYPLQADERHYLFWQHVHEKRLVNAAVKGSYAYSVAQKIIDLKAVTTPGILSAMGVDFVIVHTDKYLNAEGGAVLGEAPELAKDKAYELVKDFDTVKVYTVHAEPISPESVERSDISRVPAGQKSISDDEFVFKAASSDRYVITYLGFIPAIDLRIETGREIQWNGQSLVPQKATVTIARWLIERGIDGRRMDVKGWGGKRMIYKKNDSMAGKNVRVEIEILKG